MFLGELQCVNFSQHQTGTKFLAPWFMEKQQLWSHNANYFLIQVSFFGQDPAEALLFSGQKGGIGVWVTPTLSWISVSAYLFAEFTTTGMTHGYQVKGTVALSSCSDRREACSLGHPSCCVRLGTHSQ